MKKIVKQVAGIDVAQRRTGGLSGSVCMMICHRNCMLIKLFPIQYKGF